MRVSTHKRYSAAPSRSGLRRFGTWLRLVVSLVRRRARQRTRASRVRGELVRDRPARKKSAGWRGSSAPRRRFTERQVRLRSKLFISSLPFFSLFSIESVRSWMFSPSRNEWNAPRFEGVLICEFDVRGVLCPPSHVRVIDAHLAQRGYFCQCQCRYYCRGGIIVCLKWEILVHFGSVWNLISLLTSFVSVLSLVISALVDDVAGGIDISRVANEGDRAWNTLYEG